MARSSAVTAAAVGQIDAERHQSSHQSSLHRTQAGNRGHDSSEHRENRERRDLGRGKHHAERERRAGQPEKILHPQHRRVADACRKQRGAHAAGRQPRPPAFDGECRAERAPESERGDAERGGESDDNAGRLPCRGQRPQGDERHAAQHENRRQLGQSIPHRRNGRLRPRRAPAQADEADAARFSAWCGRQVPGGDPAQRREREI